MSIWAIFGWIVVLMVVGMLGRELLLWNRERRDPLDRAPATRRLVRRTLAGLGLAVALALMRSPGVEEYNAVAELMQLLAALGLIFLVVVVALWDLRAVSRDMRRHVSRFTEESARELRQYMDKMAAEQAEGQEEP